MNDSVCYATQALGESIAERLKRLRGADEVPHRRPLLLRAEL